MNFRELHKILFEGSTMIIGQIHKYLVTAENIYKKKDYKPVNIYRWWIKDREKNIDELEEKTKNILGLLEGFRDERDQLNTVYQFDSYPDIIKKINDFTEEHSLIINELFSYVKFLHEKDEIALNMLYNVNIWRSDKNDIISRSQDEISQDDPNFDEYCVEFAVGVKDGDGIPVYRDIETNKYGDYYDSIDLEYISQINPPDFSREIINRSDWEIVKNYSLFFSNLRKSMRTILEKIDEYWNDEYSEVKLEKQIKKIKENICKKVNVDIKTKRQYIAVLDSLLMIYASHQVIPLFKTGEIINEEDFHNKVFPVLYSRLGRKVENHKKVAKGDIDFLIYNYPVDLKVEDSEQNLEIIYQAHKDQVASYCYIRKEDAGFLFVYDNTKMSKDF